MCSDLRHSPLSPLRLKVPGLCLGKAVGVWWVAPPPRPQDSVLLSPTTALNQSLRIRASLSWGHLKIVSPNGGGWGTFSSLSFFLSLALFLSSSFCLNLPFTLTCEIALKSGGPTYFYLDCFCLIRKTEFKQNISVARSR